MLSSGDSRWVDHRRCFFDGMVDAMPAGVGETAVGETALRWGAVQPLRPCTAAEAGPVAHAATHHPVTWRKWSAMMCTSAAVRRLA